MFRLVFALIFAVVSTAAPAYEGYDECGLLQTSVEKQQFSLELDTPFDKQSLSHGLRFTFGNEPEDKKYPIVSFVHPDFFENSDELEAYERQYLIEGEQVKRINGIDVGTINSEQFFQEFEKEKVTLLIEGVDGDIEVSSSKRLFNSSPVHLNATLEEIRNISSKTNSFDAVVSERTTWVDPRLDKIASEIMLGAGDSAPVEKRMSGFYCTLSGEFLESLDLALPVIEPLDFVYNENAKRSSTLIFEYTDLSCGLADDACLEQAKYFRDLYGVDGPALSLFYLQEKYSGTFFGSFDLRKFPFDDHTLTAYFDVDHSTAPFFFEIQADYDALATADAAFANYDSENSGWNFVNYDVWETMGFDAELNVRVPMLRVDADVERQSSYFIFKIMLPILLVLLMSWSIFWIDIKQLESRLTIAIVCLLSLIAYNFVIESEVPKLGYVTLMDSFILISYLFAGFSILATVWVRYRFDNEKFSYHSTQLNSTISTVLPVVYILLCAAIGYYFLR